MSEEEVEPFIGLCLPGKVLPAANNFIEAWNKTDHVWREPLTRVARLKTGWLSRARDGL